MFEAREWLKNSVNPSALAGNRFKNTLKALEFVELLYNKGAVIVYVDNVRDDYSDTLVVKLPKDESKRSELLLLQKREEELEGDILLTKEILLQSGFSSEEIEEIIREQEESDIISFWWD